MSHCKPRVRTFFVALWVMMLATTYSFASPPLAEVPDFRVRVRVLGVNGTAPAADQKFNFAFVNKNQAFSGSDWSAWIATTRADVEKILAAYPNSYNSYWQVKADCAVTRDPAASPFGRLKLQVETAIEGEGGETSSTEAELFGPTLGVLLWRDEEKKVHIDTLTGHGRRVYDRAMKDAFLPPGQRPKKIIFGERYIGGDSDLLDWQEGIRRLGGLGFNAIHGVPLELTQTVREVGITKMWGAIYNPPGYAFNFSPNRHEEFRKFVRDQVKPVLDAGWKKEDIAFWVTSDEPGWYYPVQYRELHKDPHAIAAFHAYLKANNQTLQTLGKNSWDEVRLTGRREYSDLPSRRLFYWSNRFIPWASSRFFGEVAKAYEAEIYPRVPVMVNFNNFMGQIYQAGPIHNNPDKDSPNGAMGAHDWLEFGRERGTTSISTEDWFGDNAAGQWSFHASRLRSAATLGGVGFGSLVIPRTSGQRPGGMPQKLLALIGHGAKEIKFFTYGPEYNFPINCWSENLAVAKPLSNAMRIVAKAEGLIHPGKARRPAVAILSPQSSQLWDLEEMEVASGIVDTTNAHLMNARMSYIGETYALFNALQHSSIPVEFVDEQKLVEPDLKNYKVLYITAPDLPAEAMTGVLNWVRNGGTLVTVAGSTLGDRYRQPLSTLIAANGATPEKAVRSLVNLSAPSASAVNMGTEKLPVFGERETLKFQGAKVLASFDDNTPALVENLVGKGRILRFACYPGQSYVRTGDKMTNGLPTGYSSGWRNLIARPIHQANAPLDVRVDKTMIEAPALYSAQGVAVTVLNWSGEPQDIGLSIAAPKKVRSVESVEKGKLAFTQQKGRVQVRVNAGDVDVLQLRY